MYSWPNYVCTCTWIFVLTRPIWEDLCTSWKIGIFHENSRDSSTAYYSWSCTWTDKYNIFLKIDWIPVHKKAVRIWVWCFIDWIVFYVVHYVAAIFQSYGDEFWTVNHNMLFSKYCTCSLNCFAFLHAFLNWSLFKGI